MGAFGSWSGGGGRASRGFGGEEGAAVGGVDSVVGSGADEAMAEEARMRFGGS